MSAWMKSSSASPDFVRMSRFEAAIDAWLRPISSVTMAGSVSIGAGAPPNSGPGESSSGSGRMKPSRSRMVCSASAVSGSDLPIAGTGDGEQRGDRPALDDPEVVVDQAPFDVLGTAEVPFDPAAELREP